MFRQATSQNTRRTQSQLGQLSPMAIPAKGINARDALALMTPDYAINLVNVLCEPYGLRTRDGYTEWALNIPPIGSPTVKPVSTLMNYYPATVAPAMVLGPMVGRSSHYRMIVRPRAAATPPVGKMFAARDGSIYDITNGGGGPWVAQAGVSGASDFWTWLNFQNVAGSFLVACCNAGGYAIYNGAAWAMPTAGAGAGQIDGADPADFVYVSQWKKRLWFIEKESTSAWYLPVSAITGLVKEFNFGEQFKHGGYLSQLLGWTVDGGEGVDDYLVAVSSQGDVIIYKGTDPDDPTAFALHGVWYVGPLPTGRRSLVNTGADLHLLSHFGLTAISELVRAPNDVGAMERRRLSYVIAPLIAELMRDASLLAGWQVQSLPKEELLVIGIPRESPLYGGQYLALHITTGGWAILKDVPYASFVNIDSAIFAGTIDGRVVRAFDGPLDNVLIGAAQGAPIQCQVTPAYSGMGTPGNQKVFKLIRPTFITTITPTLKLQIMVDYGPPKPSVSPTLPSIIQALWDEDKWDEAMWQGLQEPIKEWLGCHGVGFVGTAQLDYKCGGSTILASIDFWTEQGGVM